VVRHQESADLELRPSVAFGGRELEMHGNRMRTEAGDPAGAVLVIRDVTELRRLENIRTEFVSNVSHELKTPLTVISGLVESILQDPEMEEPTRQRFMERVRAQAQRLGELVSDLLSLSRAERVLPQKNHQVLDLRLSLRESIAAIEPLSDEKGLQLRYSIPESSLAVRADMESLRQIFDNLLSNACRYTATGGRIDIDARRVDDAVLVDIADTGIGIDERQQERVFERFYRVDSARSRELGGTGLGLAIVKHVVHALDGDIRLESEPGVGSVFTVEIPAAEEPDAG
jgi:two-component system phosphate regulon sensor histidine kinase PhoR